MKQAIREKNTEKKSQDKLAHPNIQVITSNILHHISIVFFHFINKSSILNTILNSFDRSTRIKKLPLHFQQGSKLFRIFQTKRRLFL